MRWLLVSATYTFPAESTATPRGALNEATVLLPVANPADPLPANVVTTPPGVIFLMRWLLVSATYTFPAESKATPQGPLKVADTPVALTEPGMVPVELPPANTEYVVPDVNFPMR